MSDTSSTTNTTGNGRRHRAGWFDIRNVIGALLLIYGVVLVLMGIFATSDADLAKSDGVNANLWAGLGIGLLGAFFVVWAKLRPVVVDEDEVVQAKRAAANEPPAR